MSKPTPEAIGDRDIADPPVAAPINQRGRRRVMLGLAGAAGLIAVLTVVSRIAGFGRIIVFSSTVGLTDLGDVYQTINTLPNIIYEIVAGGALAAVVVPLVSAALARDNAADVNRLSSALLSWALTILVPMSVLLAVFAGPVAGFLLGPNASAAQHDSGARMLVVFAPQLALYGVGVVLTGILQAHHRFGWPAIAPMLSSITVMTAYVLFAQLAGRGASLDHVSHSDELILSVGTTAGVVVMTGCLLIPLARLGVSLRPTLKFPVGTTKTVRALVASGVATVGAQYLSLLVVLVLLQAGEDGTIVAFNLVQTVFMLPWAVLAVPVATSAFPRLSKAFAADDRKSYGNTLRFATRTTIVLCAAASALLVACARPIAEILMTIAEGNTNVGQISAGVVAYAPGLIGYGLLALLTRALYARSVSLATAVVTVAGWAVVIVANLVLMPMLPDDRVTAVGIANSVGMTVAGIGLVVLVRRHAGGAALVGVARTAAAALGAGTVAAAAGVAAVKALPTASGVAAVGSGLVGACAAVIVFAIVLAVADSAALAAVLHRLGIKREAEGRTRG